MAASPSRRVILLGASNLTLSFPIIVETARRMWGEPVEIMAAMGLGRSYGQDSRVLGRKISGIFSCALWQDLHERPPLPTTALVTDVGNDLLYDVEPAQVAEWVAGCVDRLAAAGATIVVTELPLASLARIGEVRFRLFRRLFFRRSKLTLGRALDDARAVNERLIEIAKQRNVSVIPVSSEWYGFDPIHLRWRVRRRMWPQMLAGWRAAEVALKDVRASAWTSAYLNCLAPYEKSLFGVRRRARQPSGRLADGTTISLY